MLNLTCININILVYNSINFNTQIYLATTTISIQNYQPLPTLLTPITTDLCTSPWFFIFLECYVNKFIQCVTAGKQLLKLSIRLLVKMMV